MKKLITISLINQIDYTGIDVDENRFRKGKVSVNINSVVFIRIIIF